MAIDPVRSAKHAVAQPKRNQKDPERKEKPKDSKKPPKGEGLIDERV